MIDYSFLRLKKTLREAKNIGNPKVSNITYNEQIHLVPNEFYCQITNASYGLTLAGDYEVKLVDECDNEIDDITTQFAVSEFSDIRGLNQIAFEFYLKKDYGFKPLHLKIVHTQSEYVYYSNPFICTKTLSEQTSYFVYRNYGYFNGISYDKFEGYQAIRINTYFDLPSNQTEVEEYYQITTKNTIAPRALYKQAYTYSSEYMNPFTFERANIMLIHDVVYIDGIRITNKPQFQSEERLGSSNMFMASFECFKDYSDELEYQAQTFEELQLLEFEPQGRYLNTNPPTLGIMVFNHNIINEGVVINLHLRSSGAILHSFSGGEIVVSGNELQFNIPQQIILPNTRYHFTVTEGISGGINEFEGISDINYWVFGLDSGDYDSGDYDSGDYFTE